MYKRQTLVRTYLEEARKDDRWNDPSMVWSDITHCADSTVLMQIGHQKALMFWLTSEDAD